MAFDPYSGFSTAQLIPDYYNPYKALGVSDDGTSAWGPRPSTGYMGSQNQPGQQAGQALVPGKDTPTPGSKHGAGRTVRIQHPRTGEVRNVDAAHAQFYMQKGGKVV